MQPMQNHSLSKAATGIALCLLAFTTAAQAPAKTVAPRPAPPPPVPQQADYVATDLLVDALTCRVPMARFAALMQQLRRERPEDFEQAYRQYSSPPMDLYRLQVPISAWGNEGDTILVASNRVTMAVDGKLEEVTRKLEAALEQSSQSPLSAALDDQPALVIFEAAQPGLEGSVLVGCEYRIDGMSLLDDPDDAWRRTPAAPPKP